MNVQSRRFEIGMNFSEWQSSARRELTDLLGIADLLAAPRCAQNPRSVWKRENGLGTIEKIAFLSEEGFENKIYVCIPHGVRPPYRAFLCLQGHSTGMHNSIGVDWRDEQTPIHVEGDRDFALECMRRGIPAVTLEQRYMGKTAPIRSGNRRAISRRCGLSCGDGPRWENGCSMSTGPSTTSHRGEISISRTSAFWAIRAEGRPPCSPEPCFRA